MRLNEKALFIEWAYDPQYKWVFQNTQRPEREWSWRSIGECTAEAIGYESPREAKKALGEAQFEAEVAAFAIQNSEIVFRTASVTGGALIKRRRTIEMSRKTRGKIVRHPNDDMDYMFINGERVLFYRERLREIEGNLLPGELITDLWSDISVEGLAAEGGVDFPKGKKPERLLKRIIELTTEKGDIVLDSFAGSGTTGAVAHKLGRKWIMVELREQCHTHILPRLRAVVEGKDQSGISRSVNWKGGGGFRYYRLAPSLLERTAREIG